MAVLGSGPATALQEQYEAVIKAALPSVVQISTSDATGSGVVYDDKGDIEGIRGVSADSVIATLLDRRFLTESGRKDVPGRPIVYKTTDEFLEAFGLRSLDELPPVDVDGGVPMELALPIALEETTATVPVVESDETSAPAPPAGAATETEPQPSAV